MEFEDTSDPAEPARESDANLAVGDTLAPNPDQGERSLTRSRVGPEDLEQRRRKALIAAALFDEPARPLEVGRYTIIRQLGAGGMGVVYVAYDEQLDRRVALKLLRSDTDEKAQLRLQREAQAMARLSHPNVVTVHEVGTHRGQVFVAMEFVDGQDLRRWLAAEQRSWRAVVAAFIQAGEGLAAAHEAGIVHRDFKPDNVLVGKDGRLRVADFGLAHAFDAESSQPDLERPPTESQGIRLDTPLTRTGAVMGTPAYMAPEQFEGGRTDARTDQFCFCVALWEGLYGQRPFTAVNLAALSLAVREGRIGEPPEDVEVPAWLRAVVARGLSAKLEQRWPSMRALLDALANDPQARRLRRLRTLGLASAIAAVLGGLGWLAATELQDNARQRYWNALTGQLLDIERERGVRQANDDALRARDAARMSVYRSYRPKTGVAEHEDPTVAAALLRDVEGSVRASEEWISAANEILGRPLSHAVLRGHRNFILALVFAPDGRTLYSGDAGGEVWRWDIATGRGERIIAHSNEVVDLALSREGRSLVAGYQDGTVHVVETVGAAAVRVLAEHEGAITQLEFSRDGRLLASAGKDGVVRIHAFAEAGAIVTADAGVAVHSIDFDASGTRVVGGCEDGKLRVWQAHDGRLLASLVGHEAAVFHARFIDADRILSGSDDGSVRLWRPLAGQAYAHEILTKQPMAITALDHRGDRFVAATLAGGVLVGWLVAPHEITTLASHADGVWAAALTPSGEQVITASFDTTARVLRADGRGGKRILSGHRLGVLRAVVDPEGRWLATGSYDGDIRLWSLTRPLLDSPLEGHTRGVYAIHFDSSGERVATAGQDGDVRTWSVADGTSLGHFDGDRWLNAVEFSPDGRMLAAGAASGHVQLWDVDSGELRSLAGHQDVVQSVAFDPQSQRIVSGSLDGSARVWSVSTGETLLVLDGHADKVTKVGFDPSGAEIVTASHDGTLRIWAADSGGERATLVGHAGKIWAFARSPDGRTLATASDDGSARIWPDQRSEHARVLVGHEAPVWSVAFDASGERLVTASFDASARVWSSADGQLLATLTGHAEGLWGAEFLPDGRVVTVSDDNTLRVWSIEGGSAIVLSGHHDGITDVGVSSDGTRVVTASADGTARIWRVDLLSEDPNWLHRELQYVTSYCLPAEQRVRELGQDLRQAEAAFLVCERFHGR